MLRKSSPPIDPRRREAPTTATLAGSKNGRSEAATATWSRSSTRARKASVGPDGAVEAEVEAPLREVREEREEAVGIVGPRRPQPKRAAVTQDDVDRFGRVQDARPRQVPPGAQPAFLQWALPRARP